MSLALQTAEWTGRIRELIARHGLSIHDAAPGVFAAASSLEHNQGSKLSSIRLNDVELPVVGPVEDYQGLATVDASLHEQIRSDVRELGAEVQRMPNSPDLGTIASFEESTLAIDRQHAMERVIEAVLLAERERVGEKTETATARRQRVRSILTPALSRISEYTRWGQATHGVYARARKHIVKERKREQEFADRYRGRAKDGAGTAKVEYPIPDGFDGVTALGLYLHDSISHGYPLSLAWNQVTDWGETPREGGFALSPDEQRELVDLSLYSALSYAATHSVDRDDLVERIVQNSGRAFLRERLRDLELDLRSKPQFPDDALEAHARERLYKLAETGAIRKQDVPKHLKAVDGMVDRIRAHIETRRLMCHRALLDEVPEMILRSLDKLPHARRHASKALDNPIWLEATFTGQSRLDLQNDVVDRVRQYRRHARDARFNVEHWNNPTDRWDEDLVRRIGYFRPPQTRKPNHDRRLSPVLR